MIFRFTSAFVLAASVAGNVVDADDANGVPPTTREERQVELLQALVATKNVNEFDSAVARYQRYRSQPRAGIVKKGSHYALGHGADLTQLKGFNGAVALSASNTFLSVDNQDFIVIVSPDGNIDSVVLGEIPSGASIAIKDGTRLVVFDMKREIVSWGGLKAFSQRIPPEDFIFKYDVLGELSTISKGDHAEEAGE